MHKDLSSELFNNHLEGMLNKQVLMNKGITLVHQEKDFAVISIPVKQTGKKVYLRIENVNFDIEPLYLYFVEPGQFKQLPPHLYLSGNGIAGGHDILPNPVICISSTYSYHTHPCHRNTPFDIYRNSFELGSLIGRIKDHIDSDWIIPEGGFF